MARVRVVPEPETKTQVLDAAAVVYHDKSGRTRAAAITEGGANLGSMIARHAADEAERIRKEQETE